MKYGIFVLLYFVLSCGDQDRIRYRSGIPQQEVADFSTQVDSTLLVSGNVCSGEESVIVDGVQFTCAQGDFLMRINGSLPFVALLRPSPNEPSFFDVIPLSPVSTENQSIIDRLGVRYQEQTGYTVFYQ